MIYYYTKLLVILHFIPLITSHKYLDYDYDVIIMGGGMTGISAGEVLNDNNYKILIIEAQDYIGGRTRVEKLGGYSFNVGASWIEGVCPTLETDPEECAYYGSVPKVENPMITLANKYNITSTDAGYNDYTVLDFIPEGSDDDVFFANVTEVNEIFTKWNNTMDCMDTLYKSMVNDSSIKDISYMTALFKCGWRKPLTGLEKLVEYVGFTFEYAEEAKYTSFLGAYQTIFATYGKYSNFITDPRGYAGITLGLASEYLNINNISNEPKLMINSPITKISYNKTHKVTVTVEPTNGSEIKTYNAKYGIVTFSLGVFQSDIVEFSPPLLYFKRDAFLTDSMNNYLPVLVQWENNWWSDLGINTRVIDFIDTRDNYWMWAYNFDHPSFYPGSHVWRFDIIINDAIRVQFQSDKDTIRELIDEKLSHYFSQSVLEEPIAILHHDWTRNKYVQGMYSSWNIAMNSIESAKMVKPYIEEGLYFAGEAVSDFLGDVNGAYDSGITVAQEIMRSP